GDLKNAPREVVVAPGETVTVDGALEKIAVAKVQRPPTQHSGGTGNNNGNGRGGNGNGESGVDRNLNRAGTALGIFRAMGG
ncbi:MAG TPA: hypothetical protein VGO11_13460, partial [Chthoniobacteraceae bacterium]|nr:hypothetical protein [Chthoniobacteraceae bacterium]